MSQSCLATPAILTCGSDARGQLGHGTIDKDTYELMDIHLSPDKIRSLLDCKCISSAGGSNHTVLAFEELSTLNTFLLVSGDNDFGQLPGISHLIKSTDSFISTDINKHIISRIITLLSLDNDLDISKFSIKLVSCGWNHTAIVFKCGCISLFGDNGYGQLGSSTMDLVNESILIAPKCDLKHYFLFDKLKCTFVINDKTYIGILNDESKLDRVSNISCGLYNTVLVDSLIGRIAGCGWNKFGELGDAGYNLFQNKFIITKNRVKGYILKIPFEIKVPSNECNCNKIKISNIASGQNHTIFVTKCESTCSKRNKDTIWSLGRNSYGQLMANNNIIKQTHTAIKIDKEIFNGFNEPIDNWEISNISCTWSNTYVLFKPLNSEQKNILFGVGRYHRGLLSSPLNIDLKDNQAIFKPIPINFNSMGECLDIKSGSEHFISIVKSKENILSIVSCGWNEHGNCGIGPCKFDKNNNELKDVKLPSKMIYCKILNDNLFKHFSMDFKLNDVNKIQIFCGAGHSGIIY